MKNEKLRMKNLPAGRQVKKLTENYRDCQFRVF